MKNFFEKFFKKFFNKGDRVDFFRFWHFGGGEFLPPPGYGRQGGGPCPPPPEMPSPKNFHKGPPVNFAKFSKFSPAAPIGAADTPQHYEISYIKPKINQFLKKLDKNAKFSTAALQAAELRFGLTRRCIEVLQKYNVPYYVFTKSALIARDLELHRRFRDKCLIIWSITTCNETVRRVIEPGTPPAEKLFSAIKKFSDAGIHCAMNVDPIIPLITDSRKELESLVQMCGAAGVENVFGSVMRLRSDIWERMKLVFNLLDVPDAVSRYCDIYGIREPLASSYVSAIREYAAEILTFLARRVSENLMSSGFPHLLTPLPVNRAASGQTTLTAYS